MPSVSDAQFLKKTSVKSSSIFLEWDDSCNNNTSLDGTCATYEPATAKSQQ